MQGLVEAIRVPRDGERRPDHTVTVPEIDTGGGFRAAFRAQNPNTDPAEPYGGESSSVGSDHGWANCTMSAGAMAFAYEENDADGPWGGHMRHNQDDMSGGTDLNDLKTAWQRYGGKSLTIKSGTGWDDVVNAHHEGRAIVIQGEGDCPGSGDFTGSHACVIAPEDNGSKWLWGDPDTSGWQWVEPEAIKNWAERLSSSILFAVGREGAEAMGDIPVTGSSTMLVDVNEDTMMYHLGTFQQAFQVNGDRHPARSPFTTVSPGGTKMWAIVYTRPDPDPDILLCVYNADAHNPRPENAGDTDADAIKAERDQEWETWLLAGAPGNETI